MEVIITKKQKSRDTYKYHCWRGGKIVHRGIKDDLVRREREHKQKWPGGHIKQVGRQTTHDAALEWERKGGKRPRKSK